MFAKRACLLAVFAAVPVLAACGNDDGATPPAKAEQGNSALKVGMSEMKFTPSALEVAAGPVKVTAVNDGKVEHELVIIKTNRAPDAMPIKDDEVDETGAIGEIPDVPAGVTKSETFDMKPGRYVILCALPGHYEGGMYGTMTVQ